MKKNLTDFLKVLWIFICSLFIFPTLIQAEYSVINGQIYHNQTPINLHGVNWFGFETDQNLVHGLWSRPWSEMINQIKSTGFNAVRIPYCPNTLDNLEINVHEYNNPDLFGLKSLEVMDKILAEFNNQEIYILLDHHSVQCQTHTDSLWYTSAYSTTDWISDLEFVAKRYSHLDYFVGIDLFNEPHETEDPTTSANWGGNNPNDWRLAAQQAGKAVLTANPNILAFVSGIGNQSDCTNNYNHWWGGNLEPINCYPIDPSFIPANKLVFSPHVYGPDVFPQLYFDDQTFPDNMPLVWETQFGFARKLGHALAITEWGGKYGSGEPRDKIWQESFSQYLSDNQICNYFYWSWNPNSGDTGGILNDDWTSVRTDKLAMLNLLKSNCPALPQTTNTPQPTPSATPVSDQVTITPSPSPKTPRLDNGKNKPPKSNSKFSDKFKVNLMLAMNIFFQSKNSNRILEVN